MYLWTKQRIEFMRSAGEYSDFYRELAAELLPWLKPGDRVCDAGCGLGYLSLALAPHVEHVTGVEQDGGVLAVLKENIDRMGLSNVTARQGDLFADRVEEPYDAMVFCLFGSVEEVLPVARRQCGGRVLMAVRDQEKHRFSGNERPMGDHSYQNARRDLLKFGIPFEEKRLELEFGQPFRDLAEARRFFKAYDRYGGQNELTDEALRRKLEVRGAETYPWYLPQKRKLGLLSFLAGDIPEEINDDG